MPQLAATTIVVVVEFLRPFAVAEAVAKTKNHMAHLKMCHVVLKMNFEKIHSHCKPQTHLFRGLRERIFPYLS